MTRGAAALAAVMALAGCGQAMTPEPRPSDPTAAGLAGAWCGAPGERVLLAPDGTFAAEGLSAAVTGELLAADGYPDGYRVTTEFGGVRPGGGAGTWRLYDAPSYPVVRLSFERLGGREVDEGLSLKVDHRLLFFHVGDADRGDRHGFRRC